MCYQPEVRVHGPSLSLKRNHRSLRYISRDERDGPSTRSGADMSHMRGVPIGIGPCDIGLEVAPDLAVSQLVERIHLRVHGDGGADVNVLSHDAFLRLSAATQATQQPTSVTVAGIGGRQRAVCEIVIAFTVSYSIAGLPFETATFSGTFVVLPQLPSGLDGLLGKQFCSPGHAFFERLYGTRRRRSSSSTARTCRHRGRRHTARRRERREARRWSR